MRLQCRYQGQQGDASQYVHGNCETRERKRISLPRETWKSIIGEGRAEVLRTWGPRFDQEGAGEG